MPKSWQLHSKRTGQPAALRPEKSVSVAKTVWGIIPRVTFFMEGQSWRIIRCRACHSLPETIQSGTTLGTDCVELSQKLYYSFTSGLLVLLYYNCGVRDSHIGTDMDRQRGTQLPEQIKFRPGRKWGHTL